jgi:hypothetical protein
VNSVTTLVNFLISQKATTYYSEKVFEYPAVQEAMFFGFSKRPNCEILLEAAGILIDKLEMNWRLVREKNENAL